MSKSRLPQLGRLVRVGLFAMGVGIMVSALISGCRRAPYYTGGGGMSAIDGHSFHFLCDAGQIKHVIIYDGEPSLEGGFGGGDSFSRKTEDGKSITMEYRSGQTIRIDGKDFELGKGAIILVSLRGTERQYEQLPIKFERRIDYTKITPEHGHEEYVEGELRRLAKDHPKLKQFLEAQPVPPDEKK
jgi:hypothetical protein